MSRMVAYPWCGSRFESRRLGNQVKRFCSTDIRQEYHAACRRFADDMIGDGFITMEDLKRRYRQRSPCTPQGSKGD